MSHPLRILLIEDNTDCRDSLAMLLRLWGFTPVTSPDGFSGLEAARIDPPAVVISDIGMPGLDGFEVARRLRTALADKVALIALTAYDHPSLRKECRAAGFDIHLTKPADLAELRSILNNLADQKR